MNAMLAEKVRAALPEGYAQEKRMFGGVTFMVNGNMLCCAFKDGLMVRIGKAAEPAALAQPLVRRPGDSGRMPGFVFIEMAGLADPAALSYWLGLGRAYVDPMPPKAAKTKVPRSKARS